MRCRLFTVTSALSLLVCFATAGAWGTSMWVGFTLEWSTPDAARAWDLSCSAGEMSFSVISSHSVPNARRGFGFYATSARPPLSDLQLFQSPIARFKFRLGPFAVFTTSPYDDQPQLGMTLILWPCWAAVATTGVLPVLWLRRRRIVAPGQCRSCGYDLRASAGRCPECGTPIPAEAKA